MKKKTLLAYALVVLLLLNAWPAVVDIGSRWELFVDAGLVQQANGTALKLHTPIKREVVLVMDQPWEGESGAYVSAVQDGGRVLLYYRGSAVLKNDTDERQVTCLAESTDGIHFTRPKLGLVEVGGTKDNNVILEGRSAHNFAVFLDTNPAAQIDARFKALGGVKDARKDKTSERAGGPFAFASADGVHWHQLQPEPVMTSGAFDSQNIAFWDITGGRYVCYSRCIEKGVRAIQSSFSPDFMSWSVPVTNKYAANVAVEHFYTSATLPCPTAPHLLLSFPMRFLPQRKKITAHKVSGVSDAVFMSSRDGVHWDRNFLEAWVRPGPDRQNWTDRNIMPAYGIVVTAPDEWSMYISEHYRHADNRLRRVTVRKQGFASMHADAAGGKFVTKPFRFTGKALHLNYATSAAGALQIEIQDVQGKAFAGFTLDDMLPLYGDEVDAIVAWKSGSDVSALVGKSVQLLVKMKDADLFAYCFGKPVSDI
ncbi:MAG: hypothetical protein WC340_11880 [Kiritimatiellia bacterium]